MASAYFLWKQFEDVIVYMKSIESFFPNDDLFNFNYGQALVQTGDFQRAEEVLRCVKDNQFVYEPAYLQALTRAREFR